MSAKRIQLTIPTPCQQHWQDMRPEKSGRFCDSCQKTVVDFAGMTDQQIGAYFSNKPKNVCGRFTSNQLNRDVALAQHLPTSAMKQRWLGLMTAGLLSWSAAQAQSTQLPNKNVLISAHITPESPTTVDPIEQYVTPTQEDSTWVIEGKVIAETDKAPLPGAYIIMKGTSRGAKADINGIFKLKTPQDQSNKLILTVGSIGFLTQEIEVKATHNVPLVVSLAEDSAALSEVVFVGQVVVPHKPSLLKKLRNRFKAGH